MILNYIRIKFFWKKGIFEREAWVWLPSTSLLSSHLFSSSSVSFIYLLIYFYSFIYLFISILLQLLACNLSLQRPPDSAGCDLFVRVLIDDTTWKLNYVRERNSIFDTSTPVFFSFFELVDCKTVECMCKSRRYGRSLNLIKL